MNWPGSKRFREVIESYRQRYAEATSKYDKMTITKEIYDSMNHTNSRFLKLNESAQQWEELSVTAARDKIGHSLRFANRKPTNKKQRGSASNSTTEEETVHIEPHPFPYPPTRTVSATTNVSNNKDHDKNDKEEEEEEEYKPFQRFPSRTAYFNAGRERRRSSVRILTPGEEAVLHRNAATVDKDVEQPQKQPQQDSSSSPSSSSSPMGSIRAGGKRRSSRVHDRKHTVSFGGELWCMMQEQISDWDDQQQQQQQQQNQKEKQQL